jgi:hypothetical protein
VGKLAYEQVASGCVMLLWTASIFGHRVYGCSNSTMREKIRGVKGSTEGHLREEQIGAVTIKWYTTFANIEKDMCV